MSDTARLLLLEQLPHVGPVTVGRLVQTFGSAQAALAASDDAFAAATERGSAGREAAAARRDPELRASVRRALKRARAAGMVVVTWDDPEYPAGLHHLADPPPLLFLHGRMELLARTPTVTIVGARRSTARGRATAERLGAALGRAGACVVSGLALGIDGAAHAGALRAGGDTVAVLGAGPDVAYPRFHRRMHAEIRSRGLLVSEFPPGTEAAPHHFPRRNRILAALAGAVVVVEAGRRSGSLITVDHALDLGKEIWAVPGPIDTAVCAGSNRLLADGARPLVSVDGFVERVMSGTERTAPAQEPDASAPGTDPSDAGSASMADAHADAGNTLEERILSALREGPAAADELAARFEAPIATVLALLTTLELHGEVERLAGTRFRRAA
ncbi:MAG: DNA-processing protein DprA [Longimicrobiales bacterium]|nr:DNA-processing protein DprA [Longimicrobiales bacterium]